MTVEDLIAELEQYPGDQEVMISHISGDYWKTVLASDIGEISEQYIEHSSYHNQNKLVTGEDDEDANDSAREVLIIECNNRY